ncbi:MAG: methyltransferase domain-containing protein [Candidatus Acidulodesulfobacterium sp.]
MIDKNKVKKNFSSAEDYDNHTSYHNITLAMISESIKEFKKKGKILKILDIGCGTAQGYNVLKKKLNQNSFKYFGLDIAIGLINKAKKNSHAFLINGDAELLPFKPHKFDVIFSNITIHWLNDINTFLLRCKDSLKNEGIMIFAFLISGTLKELKESFKYDENALKFHEFPEIDSYKEKIDASGLKIEYCDIIEYKEIAESSLRLLKRINLLGAKNTYDNNKTGLLRKGLKNYDKNYRNEDNKVYCTYKIAYLIISKK